MKDEWEANEIMLSGVPVDCLVDVLDDLLRLLDVKIMRQRTVNGFQYWVTKR